ncbi:MAG TPA: ATP-binding cassette domain-containing protein [Polyangiaceae bacterium]|nr:ATP-binding cassette domain-containing protein [Polyangiaceae bacterium]
MNQAAIWTDRRTFKRRLLEAMLEERRPLLRIIGTALFGVALGLASPYASRLAIDTALPDASPRLLVVVALGVVVLALHQAWGTWIQSRARIVATAAVEEGALLQVFGALVHSDYAALKRRDAGWMATTLSGAGTSVARYVDSVATAVTQGPLAFGYFIVLANTSLAAAALVVVVNLCITSVSLTLAGWEGNYTRTMLDRNAEQHLLLHSLLSALASLRGLFASETLGALYTAKAKETELVALRVARAQSLQASVMAIGSQTLSTGILLWSVYQCFEGGLSLGGMMFLTSTAAGLSGAVQGLIGVFGSFRSLTPHLERVDQVFEASRAAIPRAENPVLTSDEIVLDGVFHRYGLGRWVLENQSLVIARGSVHQLHSPSGSGKTTTLRLIAGLLPPVRGKVSVFGIEAQRARDLVLYVPQHCTLFEASIRENLELLSGAELSDIDRVAELTGLRRLLEKFPMGTETRVAAQGQNLSSGQRQLIVLTAAFASSRPILLLDEATSQVDVEMRGRIDWAALRQGRTIVSVEHG